jgi:hypothetical protein
LLGYKVDEIIGKNLSEIVYYENFTFMEQQLSEGQEFEANMTCKRKNNQTITLNCRVTPFCSMVRYTPRISVKNVSAISLSGD